MTQTLETLKNEFPALGEILTRVEEIETDLKEELAEKDDEIKKLEKRIEDLEETIDEKDGEIDGLEGDVKDTSDIPDRLLQNDLDTIGKIELFAEYIDKYNWFELKERLEK